MKERRDAADAALAFPQLSILLRQWPVSHALSSLFCMQTKLYGRFAASAAAKSRPVRELCKGNENPANNGKTRPPLMSRRREEGRRKGARP